MWVIAGLSFGLSSPRQNGLRCTFLSMGHGVGVVIETPDGKTLLYDAGSIGNGNRATRTVQTALWARRRSRIDAAVISHADLDHLNGMPGILKTIPVGTLFVSQPFLDFQQKSVAKRSTCRCGHDGQTRQAPRWFQVLDNQPPWVENGHPSGRQKCHRFEYHYLPELPVT